MTVTTDTLELSRKIATLVGVPAPRVAADTVLSDLVTESFVLVELVIELQEDYGVRFVAGDLATVKTVSDLAALIDSRSGR
jgi:acyl carrier protein